MMNQRPRPGEDEDYILQLQEEFLKEKNKNQNLQPSAQVVNLRPQKRTNEDAKSTETGTKKLSKYAQAKGLKGHIEKCPRTDGNTSTVLGDIVEKNLEKSPETIEPDLEDDKVYFPKPIPSLLGNIIERNTDNIEVNFNFQAMPSEGFPTVMKRDFNTQPRVNSVHSHQIERESEVTMDTDEPIASGSEMKSSTKGSILSPQEAEQIHQENVKVLSKMTAAEILEEQQKLLSTLDPKLVEFFKRKRKQTTMEAYKKSEENLSTQHMDTDAPITPFDSESEKKENIDTMNAPDQINDSLWENDVLSHPQVTNWLHFDSLEQDKLEWMKGIEESNTKTNEPFEARFDFKGYLLPYTMEYTEKTKILFHHGAESNRPGYSLTELFELSRSTIMQQRVMALNTIAGILEYYMAGTYKDIIELPLSKIFFVIRIAMDENKVIILEPAVKAMRNLLYNRIDEASLDALIGFEEGNQQPCLENDKSEIEELESKENVLKDFHLAEIDLISALLRTDILQRIFYILNVVKPSFNCVQYSLQILTRLARDSIETAAKIVETDHLMKTIVQNFVPITSINFAFEPQIVYNGKPVLAALKLLRVLSLQCKEIGEMMVSRYDILKPLSEYIYSGVDGTYGLRIQIEAVCVISNLLNFSIAVENALSLSQNIVTILHKHVKGTDVFVHSSILSITHVAVILQFVNKLLLTTNLDTLKHQVYPLIKEGSLKWLNQISVSADYTCAHLRLICATLDCCKTMMVMENLQMKFLNDSLKFMVGSAGFKLMIEFLIPSSNLLSSIETKDLHLTKNLMSLGGSVIDSPQKVLPVLNMKSPVPLLATLFDLLTFIDDQQLAYNFLDKVSQYLKKLEKTNPSLCDNWFTRMETDLVFAIVKLSALSQIPENAKDLVYSTANKLCYILRSDKKAELEFIFDNIIFNRDWFTAERLMNLVSLSDISISSLEETKQCYSKVINLSYKYIGPSVVLRKWQEPILPRDWIYLPILTLYSKSQESILTPEVKGEHAKKVAAQIAAEKEKIVRCTLEWILLNELCFPDLLKDISVTDRFCRIMCVFLCDNSLFLDQNIKILLQKCTRMLFKKKTELNFDNPLTGLNNFQDFYTQFLEQFQAVSYGDYTFAACVLVPLAHQHNVKWRKLLWSEYAGCLRALDCPEELMCYGINDYLYPEETDESLIKSYLQALSSNLLRPNTVAHRIASYHVENYRKRKCPCQ